MRTYDVQTVEIECAAERVFDYISDPVNLPEWTSAFKAVSGGRATLAAPEGSVEIGLEVRASRPHGTIDWLMTFPDGSVGKAYSRVIDTEADHSIYSFILTAPPVPLELLEGTLDQQSKILHSELEKLKRILAGIAGPRAVRR
jgi:uncharacterized protein YndB with AHSA1/START domain